MTIELQPWIPATVALFISLLAQRNEPKKGHPPLVPPLAGFPVLIDAAGILQTRLRLKQCKILFGSLCGARLRGNGVKTGAACATPSIIASWLKSDANREKEL